MDQPEMALTWHSAAECFTATRKAQLPVVEIQVCRTTSDAGDADGHWLVKFRKWPFDHPKGKNHCWPRNWKQKCFHHKKITALFKAAVHHRIISPVSAILQYWV